MPRYVFAALYLQCDSDTSTVLANLVRYIGCLFVLTLRLLLVGPVVIFTACWSSGQDPLGCMKVGLIP